MSATDHAAEAIRLVDMADRSYGQIEHRNGDMAVSQQIEAQTLAATAQAHATLHLAEQQRIGNLIAYFSLLDHQYDSARGHESDFDWSTFEPSIERRERAQQMVRDGLGLS